MGMLLLQMGTACYMTREAFFLQKKGFPRTATARNILYHRARKARPPSPPNPTLPLALRTQRFHISLVLKLVWINKQKIKKIDFHRISEYVRDLTCKHVHFLNLELNIFSTSRVLDTGGGLAPWDTSNKTLHVCRWLRAFGVSWSLKQSESNLGNG